MSRFILCALLFVSSFSAFALEDNEEINRAYVSILVELPVKGKLINIPYVDYMYGYGKTAKFKKVDREELPGDMALEVKVSKKSRHMWDAGISAPIVGQINAGDTLFMAVWARAVEKGAETQKNKIGVVIQQKDAPYEPIVVGEADFTQEWNIYFIKGISTKTYASDKASISFQVAGDKQILEFGPTFLFNLGPGVDLSKLPN